MKKKTATGEKKTGELIFGVHSLIEVLKAKRRSIISIYTTRPEPKGWRDVIPLLPKRPINTQYVTREVITSIAGTPDHQGLLAWVTPFTFRKKPLDPNKQPFVILLDGIQDTKNMGAILRSAYCTGVDAVIITEKGSAPITAATIKASAGLAEHVEVIQAPSAKAAVQELKKLGYALYLAVLKDGVNALEVEYRKPTCLIIGSEESGISKPILDAGERITLPQRSADISYNASVAAGILMFIIKNQIRP